MNRISCFIRILLRPDYFLCTTTNIQDPEWRADIIESIELGIPCFVWDKLFEFLPTTYPNVVPIKCDFGDVITSDPSLSLWCSDPLSKPLSKFGTSLLVALQLSVFMGYKNIYLVGCDLGFTEISVAEKVVKKITKYINKIFKCYGFQLKIISNDSNHFSKSYGTPGFSADVLNKNMLCAQDH